MAGNGHISLTALYVPTEGEWNGFHESFHGLSLFRSLQKTELAANGHNFIAVEVAGLRAAMSPEVLQVGFCGLSPIKRYGRPE